MFCKIILLFPDEKSKILLLKRSLNEGARPGCWDLPGGTVELFEPLESVLKREVLEETSIRLHDKPVIVHAELFERHGGMRLALVYFGKARNTAVKLSDEHTEFKWVSPGAAAGLDFGPGGEYVNRALEKFLNLGIQKKA